MIARRPALGFIFVTLFLDVLGVGLIIPILPRLVEELSPGTLSTASLLHGSLVGLYALMQFLFAPILGALSDRFGRRTVILVALFGSGLDYLFMAWAPTIGWFFLGRLISGITGANFAAAAAYVADVSPPEKRSTSFGIFGAAFGLGFIAGPALGGWLGEFGLRVPFIAAAGLTLANWLYGFFVLPESLRPENRRPFTLRRSNPLAAMRHLCRQRIVFGLSTSYLFSSIAHQVYPGIWVLYTSHRYGWDTRQTGLSLALVGLMAAIVQGWLVRLVIPRIGERAAAVGGLCVMAASLTLYGLAPEGWMIYFVIVFGSLSGLSLPAIQGVISKNVGSDEQGGTQGALTSLQSVAGFTGPLLATSVFGFFVSARAPFPLPGASFFVSAALTLAAAWIAHRAFAASNS